MYSDICIYPHRCYEAEKKREERERHPINQREKHPLYPVSSLTKILFYFKSDRILANTEKWDIINFCRLKLLMCLLIRRIKMRFLRVSSLTPDKHFWVFVKEIIISMIRYGGPNIPRWWFFTIFTIQLLLRLWQHAIYVVLTLKLVRVGGVKSALIMMYVMHAIKRMGVLIILIGWQTIHPLLNVMLRIKKQGKYEFCRYCILFFNFLSCK